MIYSRCYGYALNCDSESDCYQSALQAMQWKDEQYKKREERMVDWLVHNLTDTIYIAANGAALFKPRFIENFKEYIKKGE